MLLSLKKHATQLLPLLQRGFFFFFNLEASRRQEAHPPCGSQSSELEVSERSRVVYFQGQSPRGGEGGSMGQEAEGADRRAVGATAPVGPAAPSGALKVIQNGTRRLALCAPASATQPAETGFSLQTCGLELSPSLQPSAVPCWGKGTSAGNCRLSTLWAGIFPWVVGGGDIRVVQGQIYCRSLFSWLCAARLLLGGHSLRPLAPPGGCHAPGCFALRLPPTAGSEASTLFLHLLCAFPSRPSSREP